ncbi:hypothetical protein EMWEY_00046250 [Eimeria maxima]|uniref:Uncharacterized protein n=1 Tax=Eimeria maxima TaxID=5804 RepID=U6MHF7_EIMMA|nr:hypothetical protein EMWEY_00046250 [Eimeria maxima]CDJ61904.1 hypothetical protein EMWEY_00046250 [Eimeria maxima]
MSSPHFGVPPVAVREESAGMEPEEEGFVEAVEAAEAVADAAAVVDAEEEVVRGDSRVPEEEAGVGVAEGVVEVVVEGVEEHLRWWLYRIGLKEFLCPKGRQIR